MNPVQKTVTSPLVEARGCNSVKRIEPETPRPVTAVELMRDSQGRGRKAMYWTAAFRSYVRKLTQILPRNEKILILQTGLCMPDFPDLRRNLYGSVRHLLALGVGKRHAILTAVRSKSYWRLSKTLATQAGLTTQCLKERDLINVRGLWMKSHGYV